MSDSLFTCIYLLVEFDTEDHLNRFYHLIINAASEERKVLASILERIGLDRIPAGNLWHLLFTSEVWEIEDKRIFRSNLELLKKCLASSDSSLSKKAIFLLRFNVDEKDHDCCVPIMQYLTKSCHLLESGRNDALSALARIGCRDTYRELVNIYKMVSQKSEYTSEIEFSKNILNTVSRILKDESFHDLFAKLRAEDETSDLYSWTAIDNKDWEAIESFGEKAIPALEYSLILAEKTANQVRPAPPYSEPDIRILLSLWHSYFPEKLISAFYDMQDSNNLKSKIMKFLIQTDPSYKLS